MQKAQLAQLAVAYERRVTQGVVIAVWLELWEIGGVQTQRTVDTDGGDERRNNRRHQNGEHVGTKHLRTPRR